MYESKFFNMKYNPHLHNRRSVRLKNYDYSQEGAYFITICCKDRAHLFGQIINGEMLLNANGNIAYNEWINTTKIRSNIELDVFVPIVIGMPNHIHGMIIIKNEIDNTGRGVLHTPKTQIPITVPDVLHKPGSHTDDSNMPVMQKPGTESTQNSHACGADEYATVVCNYTKLSFNNITNVCDGKITDESNGKKGDVCNTSLRSPSQTIGAIVRGYKSAVTKQINILFVGNYKQTTTIWQRSFHEHIIRNEESYQNIANYIVNNPCKWDLDRYH